MKSIKFHQFLAATSLALMPLAASAASFVVPASGSGPGANDSHWQTELTLHNTGSRELAYSLVFHDQTGASAAVDGKLAARSTTALSDVVSTTFQRSQATGAIEILVADADAKKIAIGSRTFNSSVSGEFGQDIPAVNVTDASATGDVSVLVPPSSASDFRFNFGLYAVSDATVHWELLRADGTVAATKDGSYKGGTQLQYNSGVATFFGSEAKDDDAVHATVTSGKAIFYGSAINNLTGDPSYVPSIRTREDIRINFLGVDLRENGHIDVPDADHDGVLDQAIDIFTEGYPNYFRVVAKGENGEPVTLQIVDVTGDAAVIDTNGTIAYAATGDRKGSSAVLKIRATGADGESSILSIPVNFR